MTRKISTLKYFTYYMRHTTYVVLAWKDIQGILIENGIINEAEFKKINSLIIWHDNSKIDKEEFNAYCEKFYPTISEINKEDRESINTAFKIAWEHHKTRNPHHHQTLKDYKGDDWKCYLIEMICDWIAMGWETGTLADEYYEKNKDQIDLSVEHKNLLEKILKLIKTSKCCANGELSSKDEARLTFE